MSKTEVTTNTEITTEVNTHLEIEKITQQNYTERTRNMPSLLPAWIPDERNLKANGMLKMYLGEEHNVVMGFDGNPHDERSIEHLLAHAWNDTKLKPGTAVSPSHPSAKNQSEKRIFQDVVPCYLVLWYKQQDVVQKNSVHFLKGNNNLQNLQGKIHPKPLYVVDAHDMKNVRLIQLFNRVSAQNSKPGISPGFFVKRTLAANSREC